jgi:hypothetical protein
MEEFEAEPPSKVSIISQPIFLVALLLIVFNVLLFLWSMTREQTKDDRSSGETINQGSNP